MAQPSNVASLEVYSLAASEPNKPRNFLWLADVNINASLHLVILFKSMFTNVFNYTRDRPRISMAYYRCLWRNACRVSQTGDQTQDILNNFHLFSFTLPLNHSSPSHNIYLQNPFAFLSKQPNKRYLLSSSTNLTQLVNKGNRVTRLGDFFADWATFGRSL